MSRVLPPSAVVSAKLSLGLGLADLSLVDDGVWGTKTAIGQLTSQFS
jgi:hypothetical protein